MNQVTGSIIFSTDVDNSKAAKKLNELQEKIADLEKEIEEKQNDRNAIAERLGQADAAAESAAREVERLNGELERSKQLAFEAWGRGDSGTQAEQAQIQEKITAEIEQQAAKFAEESARASKLVAELDKADNALKNPTKKLDKMKEKAGGLVKEITTSNSALGKMKAATAKADQQMEKFADRIKGLAKRVFVFSLITSALRAMKDWFGKVVKSNKEASAAIAKLKGALLTLIQPLVNVIIPAFTTLVNVLTRVVNTLSKVLSPLFGTTAEEAAKAAEALYGETEALDATGNAAKKAGGKLASFDEINTLGSDSSSDSSSSESSSEIAPDFSGTVNNSLSAVAELFTGMALLALGAVLTFTGVSIPLGLAMMVAGGLMVYSAITEDQNLAAELVSSGLDLVLLAVSGALLAIGAILTISGANLPLGIALMVIGAAGLAAEIGLNWGSISEFIEEHLNLIVSIVTGALLALGAILALSGINIPLGVALLLAGAAGLAAEIGLNWDSIHAALEGPIGEIVAMVSTAVLCLGAILAFTGTNIPLGIALMAAGAIGLAEVVSINWDSIVKALQGPIGIITGLVGAALLVLGVILLFSGAGIPLGLGLIAAGGVGLAAAIIPNWDFILEKIRGAWEAIKQFWHEHIAPVFTAEWWGNLAKKAINGFLSKLETGINNALRGAGEFVNGIIKLINKIPGINLGLVDWGHVQLPRLASGAVIPPNHEFLAVLGDQKSGTNIETPLATMVDAFKQALSEMGGAGGQMVVKLYLDGRELAENQVVHINNMTRENGNPVLLT